MMKKEGIQWKQGNPGHLAPEERHTAIDPDNDDPEGCKGYDILRAETGP
jgi:hypothetical protein